MWGAAPVCLSRSACGGLHVCVGGWGHCGFKSRRCLRLWRGCVGPGSWSRPCAACWFRGAARLAALVLVPQIGCWLLPACNFVQVRYHVAVQMEAPLAAFTAALTHRFILSTILHPTTMLEHVASGAASGCNGSGFLRLLGAEPAMMAHTSGWTLKVSANTGACLCWLWLCGRFAGSVVVRLRCSLCVARMRAARGAAPWNHQAAQAAQAPNAQVGTWCSDPTPQPRPVLCA